MEQENRCFNNINSNHDLGIYIHIPFCVRKCEYCDFLSAPANDEMKRRYFEALILEIESYRGKMDGYIVPSLFIGGGTPSCVDAAYITKIMNAIGEVFHFDRERLEATIEVNPGTVNQEKLEAYQGAGINRLSFGLQTTDNRELKLLGRIHSYKQFEENYIAAREVGFRNINVDLMSALPGQTLKSWETTLNRVIQLKPEHISAYSLIIEEGTPFFHRYREGAVRSKELPDEDVDRLIYHKTKEILNKNAYHRYEISNYAKEGFECKHNSSYWIGTRYLGLGLGSSSFINNERFHNIEDLEQYILLCKKYRDNQHIDLIDLCRDQELLSDKQRMEEFMYLGLRMCQGISREAFLKTFGKDLDLVYGNIILQLIQKKLLVSSGDRIYLTEYGIDISNRVLSEFLLD